MSVSLLQSWHESFSCLEIQTLVILGCFILSIRIVVYTKKKKQDTFKTDLNRSKYFRWPKVYFSQILQKKMHPSLQAKLNQNPFHYLFILHNITANWIIGGRVLILIMNQPSIIDRDWQTISVFVLTVCLTGRGRVTMVLVKRESTDSWTW